MPARRYVLRSVEPDKVRKPLALRPPTLCLRQVLSERCWFFFLGAASRNHGKSTCAATPFFNSIGCSRVVLLLTQALSTYRPEGNPVNRYRPSASDTTKCGVS